MSTSDSTDTDRLAEIGQALNDLDTVVDGVSGVKGRYGWNFSGVSQHVNMHSDLKFLLSLVEQLERERDAYKRAKAENDERFQLAAAEARHERDDALSDLADERAARVEAEDAYGRVAIDAVDRLSALEAAQARLDKALEARSRIEIQLEDGELSDGYHTHNELYEYRLLYNAHAARGWLAAGYPVSRSKRHDDGEECFGGGWFVVAATLPTGQVSNHYRLDDWGLFDGIPELETAPMWDGHTPAEAAERLRAALGLGHEFLPVNGHPDDDECTHRADGTDETYCGEPKAAHGLALGLGEGADDA